ncbi:MAG: hypothetical protein QXD46_08360 [Thermofilum sp.]
MELYIVELHTAGKRGGRLQYLKVKFYRALKRYSAFTLGGKHVVPQSRLPLVEAEFRAIYLELKREPDADMWYSLTPLRAVVERLVAEGGPAATRQAERILSEVWARYEEKIRELERLADRCRRAPRVYGAKLRKAVEDAAAIASFLGPTAVSELKAKLEALQLEFKPDSS